MTWILLAGLLVAYGAVAAVWSSGPRSIAIVRGASLIIVGLIMLTLSHVILRWVQPMLIIAGATLATRGLIVAVLVMRNPPPAPAKLR
jgi:hypothetical protein